MFGSFVVTLREGVEAALIIAIVIAYLKKTGRPELARSVYAGLGAALLISIIGAVLFKRLQLNQEAFEGWLMLISSAFIASVVIWMWRAARKMKGEIETRMSRIAPRASGKFSVGLATFVFLLVLREGVETVLLLGAAELNTTALLSLIGGLTGLSLAVVFGVLFVKGAIRVDLRKFFNVTSIILLVVALQLLISGLHELSEALILPSSSSEMAIIGPLVKNDVFFYLIALGLAAFLILWRRPNPVDIPPDANPAERRKALHLAGRERLWSRGLAVLAVASMIAITAEFVRSANAGPLSEPEEYFDAGHEVRLPVSRVNDGKLHRFAYRAEDRVIRFIMIRLSADQIGVALDACAICGDKGYFQQGQDIICKNCTAPINPASIGQSGGCNPIELKASIAAGEIVVAASELEAGATHFAKKD